MQNYLEGGTKSLVGGKLVIEKRIVLGTLKLFSLDNTPVYL